MEESEEPDRLSNLPDDLLGLIISSIPTKEAVATSILSRRWRWQWKHLSRLNLKLQNSEFTQSEDFYVNNLFKQLIVPFIKRCEISDYCYAVDIFNDRLIYTVKYFLNHMETEELVIKHVDVQSFFMQNDSTRVRSLLLHQPFDSRSVRKLEQLFACKNLRKLELQNLAIRDESPFHGYDINRICGLLENLVIQDCRNLHNFNIDGNRILKRLEINGSSVLGFISNVNAEKLEFLCIKTLENYPSSYFGINCPNLRELQLHCRTFPCFPVTLDCQVFSNDRICLPNLMVLQTTMNLNRIWSNAVLRDLFRKCAKIQEVDIVNDMGNYDPCDTMPHEDSFWKTEYYDCISYHLKSFRIRGFRGGEREMRLVDYLITSASKLEKLIIQSDSKCSKEGVISKLQEELKLEILSIPRSSPDVSILFD